MSQFVSISKYPGDIGQITTCAGKLFTTTANNKQIILCSSSFISDGQTIFTTHTQELAYRSTNTVNFLPKGVAEQGAIYPGTEITSERERTWMYATEPMSISGLLSNGHVVATSKKEPLVLYYRYTNGKLGLYLYNLEDAITTQITSKSVSDINGIKSCQFAVGAFSSTKQQDIFVSCDLLDINNMFFLKVKQETPAQTNQYYLLDRGLGNWCSNNQDANNVIILGDFNGDKLSDLLCLNTRHAMINKGKSFRETNLIKNLPGNWADQFSTNGQSRIAIGDFDGNGLSDLASISNGARPEILFHNGLNEFISYTGDKNNDGSFIFNRLSRWCGTDNDAQIIAIDADNDGIDDLLCKNNEVQLSNENHGKVALAISRTTPYVLESNQALARIAVTLKDFTIGKNLDFVITDKNVPLFCDARIYEYHTKTSCSLNSPNKVQDFTTPIRLSNNVPKLEVNTEIEGSVYLGDIERYGEINLINEQVLNAGPKPRFPKAKFWKWDSESYIDPSRQFKTEIQTSYIRQGKISDNKQHLSDHSYGYKVHGGDCNEINFSHITLTNKFNATGKMEAYDQNNNKITDRVLLRNLAEMYILSGVSSNNSNQTNVTSINSDDYAQNSQIENVGGGAVTFSFTGTIDLQTLYQKNVTYCSIERIKQKDLLGISNQATGSSSSVPSMQINEQSAICLLQSDNPFLYAQLETQAPSITKSPTLLKRSDILELNGIIHSGGAFFPDIIKNGTATSFEIDRYGTQIDDIHCKLTYNNSIELHAYLRDNPDRVGHSENNIKYFDRKPHNELMIEFKQDGSTLYEPTKIKLDNGTLSETPASLYAGFDNIKQIKLAAFDAKNILLAWSIYQAQEKQYYLLVDYVNTGNALLKLPIYEQNFNITITNKRFGNTFYVSYRKSPNKFVVSQYSSETFAPTNTIEVGVEDKDSDAVAIESRGNTKFELQVEEIATPNVTTSNIIVVRSHNNHQGQFVKKFDVFLNEILNKSTYITNSICDATNQNSQSQNQQESQNPDIVPSKIDEAYDILRLEFSHNSKVVYHDTNRNNIFDQKIKLQNAINNIYRGATYLQTLFTNPDHLVHSKLKTTVEALICRSTMPFNGLNGVMDQVKDLLSSDLTYELHTSSSNSKCDIQGNNNYPVYRVGKIVHVCSGFAEITDNMNECNRLIDQSEYVKSLLFPETPQVQATILENLLPFMPSNVILGYANIINSDFTSIADKAAICHEAGSYRSQDNYVNHLVSNIAAGLLSQNFPQTKAAVGTGPSSCNSMTARGCSSSYDKQSNNLCLSNLLEAASTASLVAEAAHTNANIEHNCISGCDLTNPALTKLTASIEGSVVSSIDRSFIQTEQAYILRKIKISEEIDQSSSRSTSSSFTTSESNVNNVLAASTAYFHDKNSSFITFAQLGNNYIDIKAQYFELGTNQPISIEQHLARFTNVKQVKALAFNHSAILVGYSVKHSAQNDYHILAQYISSQQSITPTISTVVNIYPSFNGVFDLDFVPNPDASPTEFMVATPKTSEILTTKRYAVSMHAITEKHRIENTINTLTDRTSSFTVKINAFLDNTYNVVWSSLNQAGIYLQRFIMSDTNVFGPRENIATTQNGYPQALTVDANIYNKTVVAWQNNNVAFVKTFEQHNHNINAQILNFSMCNKTLHLVSMLENNKAYLKFVNKESQTITILDTNSINISSYNNLNYDPTNAILQQTSTTPQLLNDTTCVNGIDTDYRSMLLEVNHLGQLDQMSQVTCQVNLENLPVLDNNYIINTKLKILELFLVSITNTIEHNGINNLNISQQVLYQVQNLNNKINEDTVASLRENSDLLNSINTSIIPDTDVTSQINQIRDALNNLQNLDPQKRKFKAESADILNQVLGIITDFVGRINTDSSLEDIIGVIKDVIDTIPTPDAAQPVVDEFKDMLDEIPPIVNQITSLTIPTTEEELICFITEPVKEIIISGVRLVVPPVVNLAGAVGEYVVDAVNNLFE